MSRRGVAGVLATLLLTGWAVGAASTASVAVPVSRAQKVTTVVTGGPALRGFTTTASGSTVTSVLVQLNGNHSLRTVTAQFGAGPSVACTSGSYNLAENRTPFTCGPFSQSSLVSATLTVAVA